MTSDISALKERAKDYASEAAERGIEAVSAEGVANTIGADVPTALAVMDLLAGEKFLQPSATIECPYCHEITRVKPGRLIELAKRLRGLEGRKCKHCQQPYPEIEKAVIHYRFFLVAATANTGAAKSSAKGSEIKPAGTKVSIHDLEKGAVIQNVYINDCQNVTIGDQSQSSTQSNIDNSNFVSSGFPPTKITDKNRPSWLSHIRIKRNTVPLPPSRLELALVCFVAGTSAFAFVVISWPPIRIAIGVAFSALILYLLKHRSRWHRGVAVAIVFVALSKHVVPVIATHVKTNTPWINATFDYANTEVASSGISTSVFLAFALVFYLVGEYTIEIGSASTKNDGS